MGGVEERAAAAADLPRMTETLTLAFAGDPVWDGWAFPDSEKGPAEREAVWRFCLEAAIDYGWIRMTPGAEAVALWIPPGEPEFAPDYEERFPAFLKDTVGQQRETLLTEGFARFEATQPKDPPHYYLSLLGTHPSHRGKGLGMGLLAANLAQMDAEGIASYLESSNPANDARYEGAGFVRQGEFELPEGPTVGQFWRDARRPG